jgi:hypothetical protein
MIVLYWQRRLVLLLLFAMATSTTTLRNIMYLTGYDRPPRCLGRQTSVQSLIRRHRQHPVIPDDVSLRAPITHVALAFMNSDTFNRKERSSLWPIFMSVEEARSRFEPGTKIMVAIGGWGDTSGFGTAARTDQTRARFARNVADMVQDTGADGELAVG